MLNLEKLDTALVQLLFIEEDFHFHILAGGFGRIRYLSNYFSWIAELCSKTDKDIF